MKIMDVNFDVTVSMLPTSKFSMLKWLDLTVFDLPVFDINTLYPFLKPSVLFVQTALVIFTAVATKNFLQGKI